MKKNYIYILILFIPALTLISCDNRPAQPEAEQEEMHEEQATGSMESVHLSALKTESLGIKIDSLPKQVLSNIIEANGELEVPPQHEATVTAILGANITSIEVVEGNKVSKGQILAKIAHPDLTQLQSNYLKSFSRLDYLKKEMERNKKLYEENVGSGKAYQEALANYNVVKGEVNGFEVQLKQLNLNVSQIREGEIYQHIPVISPIGGYIEKVMIQIGQFVNPQTTMFMVVNTDHIHADLMVFEKDAYKVEVGQTVSFTVESVPNQRLKAEIYSVGKQFEQNPKAIHVHAEIRDKQNFLIPGMYIRGRIYTQGNEVHALPEEAIIEEAGKQYIFIAKIHEDDGESEWEFTPTEIRTGISYEGWVEIKLLEKLPEGSKVAWDNAYYLIGEMKKGDTEHGH